MIRKVLSLLWRFLCVSLLAAVLALVLTGFSPVFDFAPARAFSGPDIFDPYSGLDSALCWKRANFHTHTRVDGIFNECRHTAMETYDSLAAYGYDIVTFSNHNALTVHPFDSSLQVNVYNTATTCSNTTNWFSVRERCSAMTIFCLSSLRRSSSSWICFPAMPISSR